MIMPKNCSCARGFFPAPVIVWRMSNPSGNIYPCQFVQREEFRIGNVRDQKFSTIWKRFRKIPFSTYSAERRTCSRENVVPADSRICVGRMPGPGVRTFMGYLG